MTDNQMKVLAALRSGKYNQVRHALKNNEGHCAIGVVLEEVGIGAWVDEDWSRPEFGRKDFLPINSDDICGHMKRIVGLDSSSCYRLVDMNNESYSFPQIADWLENKWLKEKEEAYCGC